MNRLRKIMLAAAAVLVLLAAVNFLFIDLISFGCYGCIGKEFKNIPLSGTYDYSTLVQKAQSAGYSHYLWNDPEFLDVHLKENGARVGTLTFSKEFNETTRSYNNRFTISVSVGDSWVRKSNRQIREELEPVLVNLGVETTALKQVNILNGRYSARSLLNF